MKIGIVDLDTSHPESWVPIERALGHEVVGVWDGGSIHPDGYAATFAETHGIPRVFGSLEEMVPEVDCAIIHGCDWDTHIAKARPFIEAGKAVFIDKPLAGNQADLRQIAEWVRGGARIAGGSALRFCGELQEWLAIPVEERGVPHAVISGCGVDEFNYGIHAYSLVSEVFGAGLQSVTVLEGDIQRRVDLHWAEGRTGLVIVGKVEKWLPFYATIITGKSVFQFQPAPLKLYQALLEATLPYLAGETNQPPVSLDAWIETELAALAAHESWLNGGGKVELANLDETTRYDGAEFAAGYRRAKYG